MVTDRESKMNHYEMGYHDGYFGKPRRRDSATYAEGYSEGFWARFDDVTKAAADTLAAANGKLRVMP